VFASAQTQVISGNDQSWAPALSRAFALSSAKLNKKRGSAKKKSAKKAKAPSAKEKKRESRFFCVGGGGFVCMYVLLYVCMCLRMYIVHMYVGMYVFKQGRCMYMGTCMYVC
jgi:hypothetical protein